MSDYSSIIEYDKKGRTVRVEVYEPAIIINYEYIHFILLLFVIMQTMQSTVWMKIYI